ncbi:MAG TPA: hypothetical protein PLL34_09065 [Candidatus Mcinerneyibacteriales bacterium]|nr:hypothetical protein [Candidatus Mcinerneyibacteriales bacterium]HPQ89525.1 hypothetical protein [Candidatus Mcinerneyibacteriales bacterium]
MKRESSLYHCPECSEFVTMSQSYCPACGTRLSPSRLRPAAGEEKVKRKRRHSFVPLILVFILLIAAVIFLSPLNRALRPLLPGMPDFRETPGTFEWDGEYLTSHAGNFYIRLPSPPSFETSQINAEGASFDEYIFTAQDEESQCRILFTLLDDRTCRTLDFSRPLKALETLSRMNIIEGNTVSASPLLFYDFWPGIEFRVEIIPRQGSALLGVGRAFLKEKTLYVMEVVRPSASGLFQKSSSIPWVDSFGLIELD